jgi:hypothetical protein
MEKPKAQCPLHPTPQRRLLTLDKEEDGHAPRSSFFFSASSFSSFTINHNYNLSPLLGNYKREGKNHT